MEGDLDEMIQALQAADLAERLQGIVARRDGTRPIVIRARVETSLAELDMQTVISVRLPPSHATDAASAQDSRMTVLEVLQSTTAYFKKRKIESPRLNAEHLLAHSLGRNAHRALSGVRARSRRKRSWRRCANSSGAAAKASRCSICSARSNSAARYFFATNARWSRARKPSNSLSLLIAECRRCGMPKNSRCWNGERCYRAQLGGEVSGSANHGGRCFRRCPRAWRAKMRRDSV